MSGAGLESVRAVTLEPPPSGEVAITRTSVTQFEIALGEGAAWCEPERRPVNRGDAVPIFVRALATSEGTITLSRAIHVATVRPLRVPFRSCP